MISRNSSVAEHYFRKVGTWVRFPLSALYNMDRIIAKITLPAYQLYWRVWKPETTRVRVVLVKDKQILLVKHLGKDYWNIPSGKVERGESLLVAAHRELKEELGIKNASMIRTLGIYRHKTNTRRDVVYVFVMSVSKKTPLILEWELVDARWFSLGYLPQGVVSGARARIKEYLNGTTECRGTW